MVNQPLIKGVHGMLEFRLLSGPQPLASFAAKPRAQSWTSNGHHMSSEQTAKEEEGGFTPPRFC